MDTAQLPICPLLSLPPELRLRIYDLIYNTSSLTQPCNLRIRNDTHIRTFSIPSLGSEGAGNLLRVCKQINLEATPVLYARTEFKVSIFGRKQPPLPFLASYGLIDDYLTLANARNLTVVLHLQAPGDVELILHRLALILQKLDGTTKLKKCTVQLVLYWRPNSHDAEVALAVVRRILELERKTELNLVEREVYTELWKEAMRVSQRKPFEYPSWKKFHRFLARNRAGKERQVGSSGRLYGLRQSTNRLSK
jgi:hypothetical protein